MDRRSSLTEAARVATRVSRSWKGVDTKIVTNHTEDGTSRDFYRIDQGQENLAYGAKKLSAINVTPCGDTESPFDDSDLHCLENNYVPIESKLKNKPHISRAAIYSQS